MKKWLLLLCLYLCFKKTEAQIFYLATNVSGLSSSSAMMHKTNCWEKIIKENNLGGTRNWEFYADNSYSNTWRASTTNQSATFNTIIAPANNTASAYWRNNSGGSTALVYANPNRYYTFHISELASSGGNNFINQDMIILETAYAPNDLSTASHISGTNSVTLTTGLSSSEYMYVRYSTSSLFTSSTVTPVIFSGSTGTFSLGSCSSTIYYYFYTTNISTVTIINSDVTTFGQITHDLIALGLLNNKGSYYSTTISNPIATITGNSSVCAGGKINFIASGSGGSALYSYTWSGAGAASLYSSSGANATITGTNPSTNSAINVTITDANGCMGKNSQNITIYSNPANGHISGMPTSFCIGGSIVLIATVTGGTTPYTYAWSSGSTAIASLNSLTSVNPTITGIATGSSSIKVIISDANNCITSDINSANINPSPTVNITAKENSCTADDDKVLFGTSVSFKAMGSGGSGSYSSYTWDNGLSSGTNPSAIVSATTMYNVTVTDGNGCTGTNSKTETVIPAPNVNIAGNSSVCVSSSTLFSASSTTGSSPYTYLWSSSIPSTVTLNSTSGTSTTVTGQTFGNSNINVAVTDTYGCTALNSKNITVNARPVVTLSSKIDDVCMNKNGSVKLTVTSGLPPYSITWTNVSAQSSIISASGGSLTASSLYAGSIPFFVTDTNGCTIINQ